MGTNYYIRIPHNKHIEEKHIGKSSGGWKFLLRIYPNENLYTLDDWIPKLQQYRIFNEYEEEVTYKKMISIIHYKEDKKILLSHCDYGMGAICGGDAWDLYGSSFC